MSDGERKIQQLLAQMHEIVVVMNDVAIEHGIERVDFMGMTLHFGTAFGGDWPKGPDGRTDYSKGKINTAFVPAASGPVLNDEYWSASSFDCWPSESQRKWMFGPDESKWRRTSYDDDI